MDKTLEYLASSVVACFAEMNCFSITMNVCSVAWSQFSIFMYSSDTFNKLANCHAQAYADPTTTTIYAAVPDLQLVLYNCGRREHHLRIWG
jgi:hypothetical protein